MPDNLSPEAEVLAAHMSATLAAFRVLLLCLQRSGALKEGDYPRPWLTKWSWQREARSL